MFNRILSKNSEYLTFLNLDTQFFFVLFFTWDGKLWMVL